MLMLALVALGLASEPASLNEKVVAFARARMGQRVGDGECSALASEALRAAGARRDRGRGGPSWGVELSSLKEARPGDILQFEGAVFVRSRLLPDGSLATLTFSYPHHTAIVSGVRRRGRNLVLTVFHQNAGVDGGDNAERKVVQEWVVNLAEMKRGKVKAYRPSAE